jgi:hypothetical protein
MAIAEHDTGAHTKRPVLERFTRDRRSYTDTQRRENRENPMLATHNSHSHTSHTALLTGGGGFAALAIFGTALQAVGGKSPAMWVQLVVAIVGMVSGYLFARQGQRRPS